MQKIVISNIYSPQNIGDRAIVEGIIKTFKEKYSDVKISCLSKYHGEFQKFTNWKGTHELIHLPVDGNKIFTLLKPLKDLIAFLINLTLFRFNKTLYLRKISNDNPFKIIAEADIVVAAGGNYLFSSNSSFLSRTMLIHILNIYLPVVMGKKVILFPQSIGPFYRTYERKLITTLLSKTHLIMLRDKESYDFLVKNKLPIEKLLILPDIAFNLDHMKPLRRTNKIKKVLITALDWSWGVDLDKKEKYTLTIEKYKDNLAKIIDYLSDVIGAEVSLFPHVTVDTSNDTIISMEIISRAKTKKKISLNQKSDSSIEEILKFYSEFDLVIGSRMHSCILGITQGVPTIGVSYQPKTLGTYNLLGMPEYVVDGNSFSYLELQKKVEKISLNYEETLTTFREKREEVKKNFKSVEFIL